jgi:hypothetical protein
MPLAGATAAYASKSPNVSGFASLGCQRQTESVQLADNSHGCDDIFSHTAAVNSLRAPLKFQIERIYLSDSGASRKQVLITYISHPLESRSHMIQVSSRSKVGLMWVVCNADSWISRTDEHWNRCDCIGKFPIVNAPRQLKCNMDDPIKVGILWFLFNS